jgi:hypothetical protein
MWGQPSVGTVQHRDSPAALRKELRIHACPGQQFSPAFFLGFPKVLCSLEWVWLDEMTVTVEIGSYMCLFSWLSSRGQAHALHMLSKYRATESHPRPTKVLIFWIDFCIWCEMGVHIHYSACRYLVFLVTIIWRDFSSPPCVLKPQHIGRVIFHD